MGLAQCANPERGQGVQTPTPKSHKNIGFLSNTGLDPLKITKLQSQHSRMAFLEWYSWILPPLIPSSTKKKTLKNVVKVGPSLTKLTGSTHV